MKKNLLIALLVVVAPFAYSQNIEILPTNTTASGSVDTNEVYIKLHIKNNSTAQTTLITKKLENNLTTGHQSYFCVGTYCYSPSTVIAPNPIVIEPGMEDESFKGYLKPLGNMGTSSVKYCFVDNTAIDSACITLTFNMGNLGVINNSHKAFIKIYPNPTAGDFNVIFNSENIYSGLKLVLFDISGKKIKEETQHTAEGMIKLNTENLTNGLYLVSLVADGTVIANEKLSVVR
jgi:hypothetical protein